jgi:hypothetical protein
MGTSAEELLLKISGDPVGGQKALQDIQGSVKEVTDGSMKDAAKAATEMKERLEKAFSDPKAAVQSLGSSISKELLPALGPAGLAIGAVAAVTTGVIAELVHLGTEAEAVGGQIGKMSTMFNIPVEAVSDMRFAVKAAGGDFDTFGDSMFTFQKRIEDNGDAVGKGLSKIGLSLDSIKQLRPDEQFLAISNAVRASGSEVNKSAVAFEIFGKQGRDILPLLMKPLSDLTEESEKLGATWSGADVAAARAFRAEVTKMGAETEEAWTVLGRTVAPITNEVVLGWDRMKLAVANTVLVIATSGDTLLNFLGISKDWALASETAAAKQDTINRALREGAPEGIKYGQAVAFINEKYREMKPAADQASEAAQAWLKKLGESELAANKAKAADDLLTQGLADQGIVRGAGIDAANEYTAALKKSSDETKKHAEEQHKLADELLKVEHSLTEIPDALSKIGRSYDESKLGKIAGELARVEQTAHIANFGFEGMTDSLKNVGFEVAHTGAEIGFLDDKFIGPLQQHVLTLGEQMEEVFQRVPQTIANAFAGGGGIIGGIESIGSQITSILGKDLGEKLGKTIGGTLGKLGGPIGAAIGSLAGPLIDLIANIGGPSKQELEGRKIEASFEQSFGGFQKMMDAVGAAYAATGRGAQQAQADVKALMDAEKQGGAQTQAMVDKINAAFSEQKQDASDLTAAIGKYGFSIEQLGPAMQKQNLDGQAKVLMNDWRLLVGSGMDVVTVDQKMADSTWNYLQMAKKTGQEVPEAMKPVIQSMLEQGVFTDENGDKITEMKDLGITFSQTMTQGFDKVVTKLQELLEKMGKVPAALAAASGPINVDVNLNAHWNIPDTPDFGGAMRDGGDFMVTRPTLFLAGEAGPERATFSGANKAGSSMGGVNVYVTVEGNVSTERDLADALQSHLMDVLRSQRQFGLRGQ